MKARHDERVNQTNTTLLSCAVGGKKALRNSLVEQMLLRC